MNEMHIPESMQSEKQEVVKIIPAKLPKINHVYHNV